MSVSELYERDIRPLPPADRLRLAALILNDITGAPLPDEWSEEDYAQFAEGSWKHLEASLGDA